MSIAVYYSTFSHIITQSDSLHLEAGENSTGTFHGDNIEVYERNAAGVNRDGNTGSVLRTECPDIYHSGY